MQSRTGGGLDRAQYNCNFKTESENYHKFDVSIANQLTKLRVPSSWQKFNTVSGKSKTKHPTQKPVDLMTYFIDTYTNEGETVLDFAMGSGTTGVACFRTNRKFIGIEIDQEYYDISLDRMRLLGNLT